MRTDSIRRAGAVLLTVAAGASLLLGAGRVPAATGYRAPGQAAPVQADHVQTTAVQATAGPGPASPGAYQFLNQMMDMRATGTVPRLVQSYTGGVLGAQDYTASSIYDDALVIDAYLAERTADGRARAQAIGNAMLSALAQSAPQGGGLYDEYTPAPLYLPADVQPASGSRTTGNAAWAGNALVQLYAATRVPSYLSGAENMAGWIQANSADTRGPGGYTGGYANSGTRLQWKLTEQNIDVYAFFSLLGRESGLAAWAARAGAARTFIVSMWNPAAGRFSLGTTDRRRDHQRQSPDRGRQQLVLPRAAVPRVRRLGRLGRAEPGLGHREAARGEYLPRRPDGRLVRGHRASRRRPGRPGPGRGIPRRPPPT